MERLHLLLIKDASGKIRTEYLGADRGKVNGLYETAGKPGETVELYSFIEITRRRQVAAAQKPASKSDDPK